ncbi:hypothetical protein A1OE_1112 [Candidatus Endolissoclinum faulkneri L2]|uniref:Uncharacterized protein n=1 Tax=Candidatus Endolissoclinum faulkneri L2 TaxID=1193729 RepID=K7YI64_9PROT|nr:hypothetical protein A1OE_1112 [Candidatus Endolissoclinum faulkneri L2]
MEYKLFTIANKTTNLAHLVYFSSLNVSHNHTYMQVDELKKIITN